ncbi:rhomboid family intramembrane serine protease [Chitinophaga agrisoli]|uniref:Rhomboid family intramembrane serine protease n=1 Tax=Chitinophaga agrisoli TaxID=2607653 RepID=A0A5B2W390_9BACT|nr:rhomboid family intramembrane serine protease [Chitinophaga agrisoli]KAA2245122.1 rhomboid family intramembrane serine protease [Chitinophaga agrisoli]
MNEFRPGRFEILPMVIKNLLIINGLVYLAQITFKSMTGDDTIDNLFALHYWGSDLFRPHQIITHLFMHGSPGHLFSNMFSLWMFGATLENVWGPKRFLIFYMVCGVGAAMCHMGVLTWDNVHLTQDVQTFLNDPSYSNFVMLDHKYDLNSGPFNPESLKYALAQAPNDPGVIQDARVFVQQFAAVFRNTATLGASGAVFGILFAFGYLFPNSLIYLYFLFPIKAKYVVGIWIALELFAGIRNSAGDNVAHYAHLGGVLFSFILLKFWNKNNRRHFY